MIKNYKLGPLLAPTTLLFSMFAIATEQPSYQKPLYTGNLKGSLWENGFLFIKPPKKSDASQLYFYGAPYMKMAKRLLLPIYKSLAKTSLVAT